MLLQSPGTINGLWFRAKASRAGCRWVGFGLYALTARLPLRLSNLRQGLGIPLYLPQCSYVIGVLEKFIRLHALTTVEIAHGYLHGRLCYVCDPKTPIAQTLNPKSSTMKGIQRFGPGQNRLLWILFWGPYTKDPTI